ncbi:DNA primase [Acetobacterium wieringae]|uniref:DNA primase n=1 Tax=Acetobacterium wieringae TaxID=52694 RepID=A0A5D0WNX0_9FIRM|nr:DNA primase [Acetobacterium wieringae]TYC86010.1 DNA primase [Acetobacterium wieringae]
MTTYYSEELIQSVIDANDIVDVTSGYMTLKRVGNSFKGKCPFHNEKTASFTVSREKQLYHCFGCGAGGNVITFIMEMEKLPFMDALKFLATRANMVLPEKQNQQEDHQAYEKKKRLYELHRQAANYYYKILKKNPSAREYLRQRRISQETIREFGLGYASEDWGRLTDFLAASGFSQEEMLASGLVLSSEKNRHYDRFRSRIMFPIVNPRGQIVGFGGRLMVTGQNGPKYLNSPETPIFSKSYELYNLNHCKNFLDDGQIVIVEGYMDVISLYEKGIKNTVAALGTAFTPFHGKILERYANEVIIAFDGDSAGKSATEKAMNILKKTNLNVKILNLPSNEDPDSFVQKFGQQGFLDAVTKALTIVEYELGLLKKHNDLSQTDGRLRYGNEAINVLKQLETSLEVDYYSKMVAGETGINQEVIRREVMRSKKRPDNPVQLVESTHNVVTPQKIPRAYQNAQEVVIRYCLKNPEIIDDVPIDFLTDSFYQELISVLLEKRKTGSRIEVNQIMSHFEDSKEVKKLVEFMMNEDEVSRSDYHDALEIMNRFYNEAQLDRLSEQIKRESTTGNDDEVARLTNQLIEIKKMMKENGRH